MHGKKIELKETRTKKPLLKYKILCTKLANFSNILIFLAILIYLAKKIVYAK